MDQPKTITIGDREYPWPLAGYENAPALPDEKNDDGKSFKNNASEFLSKSYDAFTDPLRKDKRGGLCVKFLMNFSWLLVFSSSLYHERTDGNGQRVSN
jgi:hypothetical protein